MNPIRIVGKSDYRPYATFALLVIGILFFMWEISVSTAAGQPFEELIEDYALVTCRVGEEPLGETLLDGLRALFLHTSLVAFVTNMLFLWVFAPKIEEYMGHGLFLTFYIVAGFGGHILSILFDGGACVVVFDPSASIAGILGVFLLLYPTQRIDASVPLMGGRSFNVPFIFFIVVYLGAQLFSEGGGPLSGQVAPYWDEVGGFATGLLFLFITTMFKPAPKVDPFEYLDD